MNESASGGRVVLQVALSAAPELPLEHEFSVWVEAALETSAADVPPEACVTIRLVDSAESGALNLAYRQVDKPTNVLAFPAAAPVLPDGAGEPPELGDLVICQDVVSSEAREQGKHERDHLAHLVVHGTLHLVGFDHQDDTDAAAMEAIETKVMHRLGFADPYANDETD